MEISSIQPILYSAQIFNYKAKENRYSRFENEKTQYSYRFLAIIDGKLNVCINQKDYVCHKGGIVFLRPGDTYCFENCDQDFSMFNIFFDFVESGAKSNKTSCVYKNSFEQEKSSRVISFCDTNVFNESAVFLGCECNNLFFQLLRTGGEGKLKAFRQKSLLMQIFCKIIDCNLKDLPTRDNARIIIDYILLNPQEDLSGEALQKKFGYHKNYINQLLKDRSGKPLSEWIRQSKINHAKVLLAEMGFSPQQTAIELGYYDYSHFYKAFKQETGLTPTQYIG